MSASEPSTVAPSDEAADSFQPDDHAKMVLLPVLLGLGAGSLFFGPGTLVENAVPAGILLLFAVLDGEQLYRKWEAIS